MRTFTAAAVAALLLTAGCSGTAAPPEPEAFEVEVAEEQQTVIPLSYMVRQAELRTAEVLGGWMACVANVGGDQINQWSYDNWTRDHHQFDVKYQGFSWKPMSVTFTYGGFDPDLSDWTYGPVQLGPAELDARPNHTYLFDNRQGVTSLSGSLSETVTYEQSRTTTTSNRWHLDLGSKTGVTLGGEKAGGGFEQEVTVNWGISADATEANAENTSRTESEAINYSVLPGHATLATLSTPRVRSSQTFDVNGVLDAAIEFSVRSELTVATAESRWADISNAPTATVNDGYFTFTLDSFDDLESLAGGVNVDFPRVNSALCPEALDNLTEARTVVWSGTIHRDYQTSSEYQFKDVPAAQVNQAIIDNAIPAERQVTAS